MDSDAATEPTAKILELGRLDYGRAHSIQLNCVDQRIDGKIGDTFIFAEHPPTITIGRGSREGNILASEELLRQRGVSVFEVERGGDVTFHGPGQQVIYPIIDLEKRSRDLHRFLRDLEEVVIRFLTHYDVAGSRHPGKTGVWVGERKICAIGIAVKRWISYHGLALNLDVDLSYFDLINPCGFPSSSVTSLSSLIGKPIDKSDVFYRLVDSIEEVFQVKLCI